jgi:hypothetical protein
MYQSTIFGTSVRPLAPPNAVPFQTRPGDELEWTRFDFLACAGHSYDHRDSPAAVATFQGLAHYVNITDALKTVVGASFRQIH